jgi:hypothetical protein
MKKLKLLFFPIILALAFGLMLSCAKKSSDDGGSSTTSTTSDDDTTSDGDFGGGDFGGDTGDFGGDTGDSGGDTGDSGGDTGDLGGGDDTTTTDNTAPSNPTNYTSLPRNGNVYLSWYNPNDSDFYLVKVYRTTSTNPSAYNLTLIYSGSSTNYTDNSVTNYTTYYFYIYAYDSSGNASSGLYVGGTPYITISSSDLLLLQGAAIYGQDGQYLGDITGQYNTNSIFNSYGTYGSSYSSTSIWTTYGNYGSSYGSYSAFNSFTTTPPIIYKNSVALGYLTTNSYKTPGIDPRSLILYKNSFY